MLVYYNKLSIRFKTDISPRVSSKCNNAYNQIINVISKICCNINFYEDDINYDDKPRSNPKKTNPCDIVLEIPNVVKKEALNAIPKKQHEESQVENITITIQSDDDYKDSKSISQEQPNNCEYKNSCKHGEEITYHSDDEYVVFD